MKTENLLRVAILDDHPSIIDGYRYRLSADPEIEIVAALHVGCELEPAMQAHVVDVLLLDVFVPTAPDNPEPYPILYLIPRLLERNPNLAILVISMHAQQALVRAVLEAGASGYILKDDVDSLRELAAGVRRIAAGELWISPALVRGLEQRQDRLVVGAPTSRQLEVLAVSGAYPSDTTAELARRMHIAPSTLRNLLSGAYLRLGVRTRAAALAQARRLGYLPQEPSLPELSRLGKSE